MLERILLRNFQVHKNLEVDFDPHVTTFVGKTDVGKSAVWRAIRWICLNKPPDRLIRDGAKAARVRLWVDGRLVQRRRGTGSNTYDLDDDRFVAFGANVPPEISGLLKVSELNFQGQLDPVFWFSDSSGQVSRHLNQIVDLSVIDDSLKEAASRIKKAEWNVESIETRLAEARSRRDELKWVVECNEHLVDLEEKDRDLQKLRKRTEGLSVLLSQIRTYQTAKRHAEELVRDGQFVLQLGRKALDVWKHNEGLRTILKSLKELRKVKAKEIPNLEALDSLLKKYESIKGRREGLANLLKKIKEAEKKSWEARKVFEQAEKRLHKKIKGQRCPICGNVMT